MVPFGMVEPGVEPLAALLAFRQMLEQQPAGDESVAIAPDADVKLWVDAAVEERARRRYLELAGMSEAVTPQSVLEQLKERDTRDAARKDAPMKPADDAIWMDTTLTNPDQTLARALEIIEERRGASKPVAKKTAKKAAAKKPQG